MKKLFKKVFKGFKKILKPIGRELKRGLKSAGKAFGKLGPIGTLALSLMLPGLGTFMGSLGTVVGNVAATAPFAGTIMGPVGQVISGVAKVAQAGGKVFNSISKYVGDTVNGLTGGSFKGEMVSENITNAAGEVTGTKMVENAAYKKGMSTKFGDWVGAKIDKTRRTFGLETGMDSKGFESSLASNKETLSGVQSTTDIQNYAQSVEGQLDKSLSTFDINKKPTPGILDKDYKLPTQSEASLLDPSTEAMQKSQRMQELAGPNRDAIIGEDIAKQMKSSAGVDFDKINRETINVPIGQTTTAAKDLSKFGDFNKTNLEYKEIYRDELTDEQFASLKIDDTKYYSDFQNNKIDKTQKWFDTKYKNADGTFTDDYSTLTKDKFDMQIVRQDAGAIAKPAAFVGSMLAPEETPATTGSSGYVAPLSTEVEAKQYQQGAERAYAEYGYKGPNTLGGFHMEGAFGNTPINYFQQGQRTQSTMTTALPSLG